MMSEPSRPHDRRLPPGSTTEDIIADLKGCWLQSHRPHLHDLASWDSASDQVSLTYVPTGAGFFGAQQMQRFFSRHPSQQHLLSATVLGRFSNALQSTSVVVDPLQLVLVNEAVLNALHYEQCDWLLPGVPATRKTFQLPLVLTAQYCRCSVDSSTSGTTGSATASTANGSRATDQTGSPVSQYRLQSVRVYWDQAALLKQLNVLTSAYQQALRKGQRLGAGDIDDIIAALPIVDAGQITRRLLNPSPHNSNLLGSLERSSPVEPAGHSSSTLSGVAAAFASPARPTAAGLATMNTLLHNLPTTTTPRKPTLSTLSGAVHPTTAVHHHHHHIHGQHNIFAVEDVSPTEEADGGHPRPCSHARPDPAALQHQKCHPALHHQAKSSSISSVFGAFDHQTAEGRGEPDSASLVAAKEPYNLASRPMGTLDDLPVVQRPGLAIDPNRNRSVGFAPDDDLAVAARQLGGLRGGTTTTSSHANDSRLPWQQPANEPDPLPPPHHQTLAVRSYDPRRFESHIFDPQSPAAAKISTGYRVVSTHSRFDSQIVSPEEDMSASLARTAAATGDQSALHAAAAATAPTTTTARLDPQDGQTEGFVPQRRPDPRRYHSQIVFGDGDDGAAGKAGQPNLRDIELGSIGAASPDPQKSSILFSAQADVRPSTRAAPAARHYNESQIKFDFDDPQSVPIAVRSR